MKIASAQILFG